MQRHGRVVAVQRLAVGVGAPGVAPKVHPHGQVVALQERSTDLAQIGRPLVDLFEKASLFDDLRKVDIGPKGQLDGIHIGRVAIGGNLRPVHHAAAQIGQQRDRVLSGAFAEPIAHNHLALRCQGQPQVAVALLGRAVRLAVVLLLLDERPRFVKLEKRHLQLAHGRVMQPVTCLADAEAEPHDRIAVNAGQPSNGPDRHAFGQQGEHLHLAGWRKLVHNGPLLLGRVRCYREIPHEGTSRLEPSNAEVEPGASSYLAPGFFMPKIR